MLRTIGALALLVVEQNQGRKFQRGESINRAELTREVTRVLNALDLSTDGQSKTRLDERLKAAIADALTARE
jgi:hypothetical protein